MNFFSLHIGDLEQATAHLTAAEDGIYGRLMRWYYSNERPLPLEFPQLQRIARAITPDEVRAVRAVVAEFFVESPEGFRHRRCDEEIAAYRDKQSKASRSANARWSDKRKPCEQPPGMDADYMRSDMPTHGERICVGNANHKPITNTEDPPPLAPPPESVTAELRAPRSAAMAQGTRLPEDWRPDEVGWQFALQALSGEGAATTALDTFRDWWKAKPGKDGRKSDWQATWRNWIREEVRRGNRNANRSGSSEFSRPKARALSAVERADPRAGEWFDDEYGGEGSRERSTENLLGAYGADVPAVDREVWRQADPAVGTSPESPVDARAAQGA